MRITYISYHYWPPNFGGELLISIERFQDLVSRGHTVTILTSGIPGYPNHEISNGIEIFRSPVFHHSRFGRVIRRQIFPLWVNHMLQGLTSDVVHLSSTGGIDPWTLNLGAAWINHVCHERGIHTVVVHSLADSEHQSFCTKGIQFRLRNYSLKMWTKSFRSVQCFMKAFAKYFQIKLN